MEPVVIFPDADETEGVLVWTSDRDWKIDDPIELRAFDVQVLSANEGQVSFHICDHAKPNRRSGTLIARVDLKKRKLRLVPPEAFAKDEDWDLFASVARPLSTQVAYIDRLCRIVKAE